MRSVFFDNRARTALSLFFCLSFLSDSSADAAPSDSSAATPSLVKAGSAPANSRTLQGTLVENEVSDELERVGIKCKVIQGANYGLAIDSVKLGSPALNAGLSEGDLIENITQVGPILTIQVKRDGHIYQCAIDARGTKLLSAKAINDFLKGYVKGAGVQPKLAMQKPTAARYGSKIPVLDVTPTKNPILDVTPGFIPLLTINPTEPAAKILSKCNIELIIDISQSMNEIDGTGELSKFEWCHKQVTNLAEALRPFQKNINITTFNIRHTTYEDCDPSTVEQIYAETSPNMNTDLVDPLLERCNVALSKTRQTGMPTIIAVITDGLPNVPSRDPKHVNAALIPFTRGLASANEVAITMLQIGDTFEGRDFCVDLDDNLVREGAKFDIVDTKTFGELKQTTLVQALVDALTHKQSAIVKVRPAANQLFTQKDAPRRYSATSHPGHFVDEWVQRNSKLQISPQLNDSRADRHALEQQLLGQ